jgi:microcystin-dependent protein
MKLYRLPVLTLLLFTFYSTGFAQIGINTITPDSSASLHIVSKPSGSGLIIPELTEAQRLAIHKPAKGLMVFDLTANLFYMNMDTATGNNWYAINPWLTKGDASTANFMYTSPVVSKVGIGIQVPQATLDVNGDIKASTAVSANSLNITGFSSNALVPTGAIMMWSGDPLTLPAGWALCDGTTYGTLVSPDLRGRFIVGFDKTASTTPTAAPADGTTINYGAVKNTGGETGHTLSKSELPKHSHIIGDGTDGSSITNPGNHTHTSQTREVKSGSGATGVWSQGWQDGLQDTDGGGSHIHTGITGDGTTDGLINQVHENRPPYYVLAYIIKLP